MWYKILCFYWKKIYLDFTNSGQAQPAAALPLFRRRNINIRWSSDRPRCAPRRTRSSAAAASQRILSSSTRRKNLSRPIWKSRALSSNVVLPGSLAAVAMDVCWCLVFRRPHSRKHMSKASLTEWVSKLTSTDVSTTGTSLLGGIGSGGDGWGGVGELDFVSDGRRRRWAHSNRARLYLAHAWWRLATSLRRFSEWRSCCLSCKDNISFLAASSATNHCRRLFSLRRTSFTVSTCCILAFNDLITFDWLVCVFLWISSFLLIEKHLDWSLFNTNILPKT